jgi:hypothetical protein
MANTDAPFGLRPVRHLTGGLIRSQEYTMATGIDSVGQGDAVRLVSGKVILSTTGTRPLGSFNGFRAIKSSGEVVYDQYYASGSISAAKELTAFVYDDPYIVYEVQVDDDTTPLATTGIAVGQNLDLLAHAAADANTKQSKAQLDATSLTTGAAQFRVHKLSTKPNNAWGGNEIVEVTINEHQVLSTGITGNNTG